MSTTDVDAIARALTGDAAAQTFLRVGLDRVGPPPTFSWFQTG